MSAEKKRIRERFRTTVHERDRHRCRICGNMHDLDAHHITDRTKMPNGGYVKENGITLCAEHHLLAEKFHQTDGQAWEPGLHPDDLYRLIGSSYERAVAASERLARR